MLLKLFNRFFGAGVAGARFFFGFRPRLLGIGKQWVAGIRRVDFRNDGRIFGITRER